MRGINSESHSLGFPLNCLFLTRFLASQFIVTRRYCLSHSSHRTSLFSLRTHTHTHRSHQQHVRRYIWYTTRTSARQLTGTHTKPDKVRHSLSSSRLRVLRPTSTYGPITIAIRARFDYDSSTIQHPTRSYVLSSNNEHVNSFPLL